MHPQTGKIIAETETDHAMSYYDDRGDGQYTRLVPVEILPVELKNEGMIVLPVPRQPGPDSLLKTQPVVTSRVDSIIKASPGPGGSGPLVLSTAGFDGPSRPEPSSTTVEVPAPAAPAGRTVLSRLFSHYCIHTSYIKNGFIIAPQIPASCFSQVSLSSQTDDIGVASESESTLRLTHIDLAAVESQSNEDVDTSSFLPGLPAWLVPLIDRNSMLELGDRGSILDRQDSANQLTPSAPLPTTSVRRGCAATSLGAPLPSLTKGQPDITIVEDAIQKISIGNMDPSRDVSNTDEEVQPEIFNGDLALPKLYRHNLYII